MSGQLDPNRAQANEVAACKPGAGKAALWHEGREALHSGKRPRAADDAPAPNPLLCMEHPAVRADEGEVFSIMLQSAFSGVSHSGLVCSQRSAHSLRLVCSGLAGSCL